MRWVGEGRGEVLYCVYYTLNVYYHTCHVSFRNASFRNAYFCTGAGFQISENKNIDQKSNK